MYNPRQHHLYIPNKHMKKYNKFIQNKDIKNTTTNSLITNEKHFLMNDPVFQSIDQTTTRELAANKDNCTSVFRY